MQFVSEEYCYHALGYLRVQQTTTLSQHQSVEVKLASLGKSMTFNSYFNFKLSEGIGVFG
jgi:hypothetical protein